MSSRSVEEATPESPASNLATSKDNFYRPLGFFHATRTTSTTGNGHLAELSSWNSRASRKHRITPAIARLGRDTGEKLQDLKSSARQVVGQRLKHPSTRLKPHLTWDVSFWVAVVFVLGSTAWIVNGFYLFLPLVNIGGDHLTAAAWWAFVGGTLFEIGSYLMVVEALNCNHEELFGPALWELVRGPRSRGSNERLSTDDANKTNRKGRYRWIGLGDVHELGYLACSIQLFGASIFWVSTITGLPHVIPNLTSDPSVPIADIFYWTPQVIGGTGFIISSILLMLEVQTAWWKPNLTSLGWHIAVWNLIGALGFTLCGAFGYGALNSTKVNYQSVLSTFWGSFAFEIGSVIQLWETLWRESPDRNSESSPETETSSE